MPRPARPARRLWRVCFWAPHNARALPKVCAGGKIGFCSSTTSRGRENPHRCTDAPHLHHQDKNGTIEFGELKDAVAKLGAEVKDEAQPLPASRAYVNTCMRVRWASPLLGLCSKPGR